MGISKCIATAIFNIGINKSIILIQVYAPTSIADESEVDDFYRELSKYIVDISCDINHQILIMGDFNSKFGKRNIGFDIGTIYL